MCASRDADTPTLRHVQHAGVPEMRDADGGRTEVPRLRSWQRTRAPLARRAHRCHQRHPRTRHRPFPSPLRSSQKSDRSSSTSEAVPLGSVAVDAQVSFRVQRLECTDNRIEFNGQQPADDGRFCFLHVLVRNDRLVPAGLNHELQYLVDKAGQKHPLHDQATILYSRPTTPNVMVFGEQQVLPGIAPGRAAPLVLIFDIPPGVTVTAAELHASAAGVRLLVEPVPAITTTFIAPTTSTS